MYKFRTVIQSQKRRSQINVNHVDGEIDLSGQVAIVTGGGRGIGRGIALGFAKSRAKVAVTARSTDQLIETVALIEQAGGSAMSVTADVTDQQAVERMVDKVEKELGPVDVLVNNAGVSGPMGPLWTVEPDTWWRTLEVNLRGPYLCTRTVLPGMVTRGFGRVLFVASIAGQWPWPNMAAYATSKCALLRFTENLAAEVKEHGISTFSIGPGFVRTAMIEDKAGSSEDEKWLGGLFRNILAEDRVIPLEHVVDLVLLLASGRADSLSGCFFKVENDVTEMVQRAEEIQQDELYRLRLRT